MSHPITHIMADHGVIPAETVDPIAATRATAGQFGHPEDGGLIERIARAWACMEGKGARFDACKAAPKREQTEGYYGGYMAEAEELAKRAGLFPTVAAIRALPAAQPARRVTPVGWFHFDQSTGEFTGEWCSVMPADTNGFRPLYAAPAAQDGAEVELVTEADKLRAQLADMSGQYTRACQTIDKIAAERDEYKGAFERTEKNRDALAQDNDELIAKRDALKAENERLMRLIRLAHPVMRVCGWHLAPASVAEGSDGILEAACAEIEEEFGDVIRAEQGEVR